MSKIGPWGWLVLGVALLGAAVPACSCNSNDTETGTTLPGLGGGGHGGATTSNVVVDPPTASLEVPLGGSATQAFTATATVGGQSVDVTAECDWSVDQAFGMMTGPVLTANPLGGETDVTATCGGATGSAHVTITLVGQVLATADTPSDAADLFTAATLGADAARVPAIEYPIAGAAAPRNIPAIEAQWTTAQNDLFHVSFTSAYVAVDLYTTAAEGLLSPGDWQAVTDSTAGASLSFVVEGLAQADPATKFASAPVLLEISPDEIDKTAIYYWASSQGQLMTQEFGQTGAPTALKGDCSSCHALSRTGSRIGYSRCVGNDCNQLWAGFMRYDKQAAQWTDTVDANGMQIHGSYFSFSPLGNPYPTDAQSLCAVSMFGGSLELYDPDTGAAVASNLAAAATVNGTRSALMPDWSPDGAFVAFASTPHLGQWIDLSDGAIARVSYAFDGQSHTFGALETLVAGPIDRPTGSYTNFFFPSYSADGALLVFDGARAAWRNFTDAASAGQRLFLADAAASWTVELERMNGPGDLDITWPHWAPGTTPKHYWVVFASERDYGHRLTAANSAAACVANGVAQCKQLWIGAVERSKVAASPVTEDPSLPPVWLPGQDLGADNISPYWTVPTSEIPD